MVQVRVDRRAPGATARVCGAPRCSSLTYVTAGALPFGLRAGPRFKWRRSWLSAARAAQVYARDDEAPSTEATLGVEEEPAAARDGQEPAARQPRGRRKKTKS